MTTDATRYVVDLPEVWVDGHGRVGHGERLPAETTDKQLADLLTDRAVVEAPAQAG